MSAVQELETVSGWSAAHLMVLGYVRDEDDGAVGLELQERDGDGRDANRQHERLRGSGPAEA